jgi:hypothetical protein
MTDKGIDSFVEQLVEFDSRYTPNHLLQICSNKEILKRTHDEDCKKKDWDIMQCFGTLNYVIFSNN